MDFLLFVVASAMLLVRPEEMFPPLAGLQLYLMAIGLCVLLAAPRLVELFRPAELAARPVTCCVLGFWAAVVLSRLALGQVGLAQWSAGEFGKSVLYYLVMVSVIDTPGRLRAFLGAVVVFVLALTTAPLLQHYQVIDLPVLEMLERGDQLDPETGEPIRQLISTGIYSDPNDFCLVLVTGILCGLYRAATAPGLVGRALWLVPVGVFGYAVVLTKSRGGLLGLGLAAGAWAVGRYGWRRTLPLAAVLAVAAVAAGGRQTNINLGEGDTARQRFELWNDGFVVMRENPVTGIGWANFWDRVGLEAHNSFVHAYVETGLVGGSLFLGLFVLAAVGAARSRPADPTLAALRPFVQAIVIGYAAGVLSISRCYIAPTYLVVGVGAAYLRMAPPPGRYPWVTPAGAAKLYGLGLAGLVVLFVATKVLLGLGG